ncbi:TRAP transporter substrate-binding protein DctP [Chloroflexota bacterium]
MMNTILPIELRISFYIPPWHGFYKAISSWARELETATINKVKCTFHGDAKVAPVGVDKQYDMVTSGVADLAIFNTVALPGRFPLTEICRLPYLFTSQRQATLVVHELVDRYLRSEYREVELLTVFPFIEYYPYTAKKQVKTLDDIYGLKISASGGVATETTKALGAVPVRVGFTERNNAIEKGLVDGLVWLAESVVSQKVHHLIKYATIASDTTANMFPVVMNLEKWEKLPSDVKDVINMTGRKALALRLMEEFVKCDEDARQVMEESGTVFYTLPPDERARWVKATSKVHQNWIAGLESKKLPAKQIYDTMVMLMKSYAD